MATEPHPTNAEDEHKIRAVIFPHGEWLIAQCLDYDIVTRVRQTANPIESLEGILSELERILAAHLVLANREGRDPFADIPKAPKRFWEMYETARFKLQRLGRAELPGKLELRAA